MPELEEGNLWIRGTFPLNVSLDAGGRQRPDRPGRSCSAIPRSSPIVVADRPARRRHRPDRLLQRRDLRAAAAREGLADGRQGDGLAALSFGGKRPRTKAELINEMNDELNRKLVGVDWNFSQNIRDNVMESLSGVKGDNSVKIIGPDLDELETLAERGARTSCDTVPRHRERRRLPHQGPDRTSSSASTARSASAGASASADVQQRHPDGAWAAKAFTQMIEGEKIFDITLRWPKRPRGSETSILDIPVDVANNTVTPAPSGHDADAVGRSGSSVGQPPCRACGSQTDTRQPPSASTPRLRLRDLVTPVGDGRRARPQRHVSSGRAPRPSTASRASG